MSWKEYLNKKVTDPYGKMIGKVIGCNGSGIGNPMLLGIEFSEGGFQRTPSSRLTPKGENLILDESWMTKSNSLRKDLNFAIRKSSALSRLYNAGEVSKEVYESLNKEYNNAVAVLEERRESLRDRIEERSDHLFGQTNEIESYVVDIKIARELGELDGQSYSASYDSLNSILSRLKSEQNDLEAARTKLFENPSNTTESTPYVLETPMSPQVPEPSIDAPIVVRIKEAGF